MAFMNSVTFEIPADRKPDRCHRYFQDKFPFPFLLCFGIKDLDLETQRREREVEDLQEQLSKTAADARH